MARNAQDTGFLDFFSDVPDPRMGGKVVHPMPELLFLSLCAMICGSESWNDIELYGHTKLEFLREHLPYTNGIPSDDTLRRFFRCLDPAVFEERFVAWAKTLLGEVKASQIAIDGKSIRGSKRCGETMKHLVGAFACEGEILLAHVPTQEKSNEITAIPELLKWLDLQGALVSIDAMGCQYKIADTIKSKEGDYLFSLKGNQSNLNDDVIEAYKNTPKTIAVESSKIVTEKGHGRIEQRVSRVITDVSWLTKRHKNWSSIATIIEIESTRILKDKESTEKRYYISSRKMTADEAFVAVRKHWFIENKNHYVLDVSFGEDACQISKGNAPENIAILRRITLNMLKQMKESMPRVSYKAMRKKAGWENSFVTDILVANFMR